MLIELTMITAGVVWGYNTIFGSKKEDADQPFIIEDKLAVAQNQAIRKGYLSSLEEKAEELFQKLIDATSGNLRSPLQELLDNDQDRQSDLMPLREEDRFQNRQIIISAAALGITSLGALAGSAISILATPLIFYLSLPIYRSAWRDLRDEGKVKTPVLISIFSTGAWLTAAYWSCTFGIFCYSINGKLINITKSRSQENLRDLFARVQRSVWVLIDGVELEVPLEQVRVGDVVVVRAGQIIPVDGRVVSGMASVDQRHLTGEATPSDKGQWDVVHASCMVVQGSLRLQVAETGQDTVAAQITRILEKTTAYQVGIEQRGIQMANRMVAPSLLIAGAVWPLMGASSALAVLSAMPGGDMRFAGPVALLNFLNLAAQDQILVKDGRGLELLGEIDTVLFDKTGTLTMERFHVAQIHLWDSVGEEDLLRFAASAESRQTHPIAQAILAEAKRRELVLFDDSETRYDVGFGIHVRMAQRLVQIGSERLMESEGLALPPGYAGIRLAASCAGHTIVLVALDGQVAGALELRPTLRPDSLAVVQELQRRKLVVYIVSGDQEGPTRQLAETLGIKHYYANVLPDQKAQIVEELQERGRKVCFIGDGVNDGIALKKANVSISLRGASMVATDSAQIVLMDQNLKKLIVLLDTAAALEKNLRTSFGISVAIGSAILGGVLFFSISVGTAIVIGTVMMWSIVLNAMRPRLTSNLKKSLEAASYPSNERGGPLGGRGLIEQHHQEEQREQ